MDSLRATGIFLVAGQQDEPKKLREVNIDVLQYDDNENPKGLVAVKRRVDATIPLRSTLDELTGGANYNEERENMRRFILGFETAPVKLKNKTAQIDFTTEYGFEWGEPMRTYFTEAIEKTFLQFPEVKTVKICVDGVSDFLRIDVRKHKKC